MNLSQKLFFKYLLALIIFAAFLIIINLKWIKVSEQNSIQNQIHTNNEIALNLQTKIFEKINGFTQSISKDKNIINYCKNQNSNKNNTNLILNTSKLLSNSLICYILDKTGTVIASTNYNKSKNVTFKNNNYSYRPYFKEALKDTDCIYPALGANTNERGIYFSSPIKSGNKIIGVTAIKVSASRIDKILDNYKNNVFLSTNEGIVFSSNNLKELFTYTKPLKSTNLRKIIQSRQFQNVTFKPQNLVLKSSSKYSVVKTKIPFAKWTIFTVKKMSGKLYFTKSQKSFILQLNLMLILLAFLIILLYIDADKKKRVQESLRIFSQAVEQSPNSVVITDTNGIIQYVNDTFTILTGYSKNEAIGQSTNILKANVLPNDIYKNLWSTILSGKEWRGEFCNRKKNLDIYWESAIISPIKNSKGDIAHFIALKEDITTQKLIQEKLNFYATTDEMTSCVNRRTGLDILKNQLKTSKQANQPLVVCFADVNGLKAINDTLGHDMGDQLIIKSVSIIRENLRETDTLCRLGGDEFLVILPKCNTNTAYEIWDRIENTFEHINNKNEYPFTLSISRGFAEFDPKSEIDIDTLIKTADTEMYKNKKAYKERKGII